MRYRIRNGIIHGVSEKDCALLKLSAACAVYRRCSYQMVTATMTGLDLYFGAKKGLQREYAKMYAKFRLAGGEPPEYDRAGVPQDRAKAIENAVDRIIAGGGARQLL